MGRHQFPDVGILKKKPSSHFIESRGLVRGEYFLSYVPTDICTDSYRNNSKDNDNIEKGTEDVINCFHALL